MARERNAVSITGKISDGLSRFESYNNKEIYRFDQLGFTITGRLISGLSGFLIIVIVVTVIIVVVVVFVLVYVVFVVVGRFCCLHGTLSMGPLIPSS